MKQNWLDTAEVIDALRIFPRILVGSYFGLAAWTVVYLILWYCRAPADEHTVQVTAFFGMLTGGLFGLAVYIFKLYTDGGRDWTIKDTR